MVAGSKSRSKNFILPPIGERASRLNSVPNAGAKGAEFVSECAATTHCASTISEETLKRRRAASR